LYLVEHFFSIQGEGKYQGKSAIFLRFGLCNFECRGFLSKSKSPLTGEVLSGCDSLYSVDKKHFGESWQKIDNLEPLLEIIDSYQRDLDYFPDIIITGGEPLLNFKNRVFYSLVEQLVLKYRVTVETNASIFIDFDRYSAYKNLIFAMSVKLENSKESFNKRVNPKAIEALVKNSKDSFFKFVLDRDYIKEYQNSEIESITKIFPNIDIFCMPCGDSIEELNMHDKSIIEFCKNYNYLYSDRLHIRIYNRRKGV